MPWDWLQTVGFFATVWVAREVDWIPASAGMTGVHGWQFQGVAAVVEPGGSYDSSFSFLRALGWGRCLAVLNDAGGQDFTLTPSPSSGQA